MRVPDLRFRLRVLLDRLGVRWPPRPVGPAAPRARLARGASIFEQYVMSAPSPQTALDIFAGEWSSLLPGEWARFRAGTIPLFEDTRLEWGLARLGGAAGKTVVELGPLEAGHTTMLEHRGAAEIVAIEANTRAYLKCLVVKELFQLKAARFECGDFVAYLRETPRRFDLCVASGVLYHMKDPLELLGLIAARSGAVFLWTHYYDPAIIGRVPAFARLFTGHQVVEGAGGRATYHRREYPERARRLAGFSGGGQAYAHWLGRDDILATLGRLGLSEIETGFEEPYHLNGPAFCVAARRP